MASAIERFFDAVDNRGGECICTLVRPALEPLVLPSQIVKEQHHVPSIAILSGFCGERHLKYEAGLQFAYVPRALQLLGRSCSHLASLLYTSSSRSCYSSSSSSSASSCSSSSCSSSPSRRSSSSLRSVAVRPSDSIVAHLLLKPGSATLNILPEVFSFERKIWGSALRTVAVHAK